jgi:hypothetical protein
MSFFIQIVCFFENKLLVILQIHLEEQTKGTLKLKSVSKYNHFMGRYSDTNVEKCAAILLLKIEQNGGFLEI